MLLLSVFIITVACQQQVDRFTVDGVILEANEKTLYFDRIGADKTLTVDSVVLDEEGQFSFSHPGSTDCFEFYRLRIDGQFVNLVVDSTETISVYASLLRVNLCVGQKADRLCKHVHRNIKLRNDEPRCHMS